MKKTIKIISSILIIITLAAPSGIVAEAASASTIKSKVISVAENEVGYEGTGTYSKYGEWYGYQGSWCTTFVLWCFNKAGNELDVKLYGSIVPSGGNCNSMISWFKNKDRYHTRSSGYTPKAGDLVFFDWSGNGSSQHVGIVTSISGSTVYTVEGNCSGKVKDRKYTSSGSKPYNNISSIMGYGSPNWESVADGSSATTKKTTSKKTTAAKKTTTAKKQTTAKKPTAKKPAATKKTASTKKSTTAAKKESTTKKEETATSSTEKKSTAAVNAVTDMKLHTASNELEIGDSVQLDYTIEPSGSNAVVGYFCDEENIIEISNGGKITAIGEGTATVVVCANDEIYRQCDFTVSEVSSSVTRQSGGKTGFATTTQPVSVKKTNTQRLNEIGINIDKLKSHSDYYIIPASIAGVTAVVSLAVMAIKKIAEKRKSSKKTNIE